MASSQIPNLNYATEYQRALEQAYPYVLYFGALYNTPNNGRFKWINSKTIEIPSVSTSGRTNADRDSISTAQRNYNNAWVAKTLTNERKWSTLVHPKDIDQTNMVASIANITQTFNEEHKFPEMDAYTISRIHALLVANGTVTIGENSTGKQPVTTGDQVLTEFDRMMEAMDDARVPAAGRVLYLTNHLKALLKTAAGITRNWEVQTGGTGVNRVVESLDGVQIIAVPQQLMMTAYDFSDKNGWAVDDDAKKINMVLIRPESIITPVSYTFSKLDAPSALSEGKYYYYEESFEDVFILDNKAAGIQMNVDATTPYTYNYTVVTNPTGNPSTSGYYEVNIDGQFTASTDTVVNKIKTYYTRASK